MMGVEFLRPAQGGGLKEKREKRKDQKISIGPVENHGRQAYEKVALQSKIWGLEQTSTLIPPSPNSPQLAKRLEAWSKRWHIMDEI